MKYAPQRYLFYFLLLPTLLAGCRKLIQLPSPQTEIITQKVFSSDATATAAQFAIYSEMSSSSLAYFISLYSGMSADELKDYSGATDYRQFENNALSANNGLNAALWSDLYKYIYQANAVIEGVSNNARLTPSVVQNLTAQALFIRAFCYFYLVNLYGDVPLILHTNYETNAKASRTPADTVYAQIVQDLIEASNDLPSNYAGVYASRIVPDQWAAKAVLARVYLYKGDWDGAISIATNVLASGEHQLEDNLDAVFLKDSREALWQLQPVVSGFNSAEGAYFLFSGLPTQAALSASFIQHFESGDARRSHWIDSTSNGPDIYYFPYKYKAGQGTGETIEFSIVLRLSELYLIRAEAYGQVGRFAEASADLNVLRNRAQLPALHFVTAEDCSAAVVQERRAELFCEWGHRWLDLRRLHMASSVLSTKPSGWQDTDAWYPIPQSERANDPALTQNPGY